MDGDNASDLNRIQCLSPLLMVQDLRQSLQFYRDGLGFEVKDSWSPDGELAWCWLQRNAASLMIEQQRGSPPLETRGAGVVFYFVCDDAAVMHNELRSRGVDASEPAVAFYGMNQTFITDPDGYELCFESRTERS